jgi:hypothetical protein
MKNQFLISDSEKSRILNLHESRKPHHGTSLLNEAVSPKVEVGSVYEHWRNKFSFKIIKEIGLRKALEASGKKEHGDKEYSKAFEIKIVTSNFNEESMAGEKADLFVKGTGEETNWWITNDGGLNLFTDFSKHSFSPYKKI